MVSLHRSSSTSSSSPPPSVDALVTRVASTTALRTRLPADRRMIIETLNAVTTAGDRILLASSEAARRELADALDALDAFLDAFNLEPVVFHIASVRRMFEQLSSVLTLLNEAENKAGTATKTSLQHWQDALSAERVKEEKALAVVAKNSTMLLARNVKGHEAMLALTLMKFEIDLYPAPRNNRDHLMAMKGIFFSIVRSSNGRVTKIPPWFSPEYMVISEQKAAISRYTSGLATCTRAKWADRHNGDKPVDVVLKRLPLDSEGIEPFRLEVERWYAVDSPYVVKLLAACHCSDPTLLVLGDAAQLTLYAFVRSNAANQLKIWAKTREAALGLLHLKEKHGTVHGNLKRSNILVAADGTAKVSDFGGGIVTLQNLAIQHKKWGADAVQWRAPEFRSHRKRPTYQADVFSLGVCLLDAIVDGFKLPTTEDLQKKNGVDRPPGLSDQAWGLIKGMTAFKPEDRTTLPNVIQSLEELDKTSSKHLV